MADHVYFYGDDRLEGILEKPGAAGPSDDSIGDMLGGVVVAHPHPLYGSTMAQPLVYRIAQACRDHRMATLRFNFRGVGKSLGRYHGVDEYKDVETAATFLRGNLGPGVPLALAGYSFGSVMTAMAAGGPTPVEALARTEELGRQLKRAAWVALECRTMLWPRCATSGVRCSRFVASSTIWPLRSWWMRSCAISSLT